MANFEKALRKMLEHEGVRFNWRGRVTRTGYSNDPDDPGGETNFGITRRNARRWGFKGPLANMTYEWVCEQYRTRYWGRLRCGEIPAQELAEELFDTGVNCGVVTTGRFLQQTLNAMNNRGRRWRDIAEDGKVGRKTIGVVRKALRRSYGHMVLVTVTNSLQCVRYVQLCRKKPRLEKYFNGWVYNRCRVRLDR